MDVFRIARDSLSTVWNHKYLWLFGFFVAGAGSGGGHGGGAPTASSAAGVPQWVFLLLAGAAVLGLAALVMYIISEGALIEGVGQVQRGERYSIKHGMRGGLGHFWRVLDARSPSLVQEWLDLLRVRPLQNPGLALAAACLLLLTSPLGAIPLSLLR